VTAHDWLRLDTDIACAAPPLTHPATSLHQRLETNVSRRLRSPRSTAERNAPEDLNPPIFVSIGASIHFLLSTCQRSTSLAP